LNFLIYFIYFSGFLSLNKQLQNVETIDLGDKNQNKTRMTTGSAMAMLDVVARWRDEREFF
jgi:hypothetical protein